MFGNTYDNERNLESYIICRKIKYPTDTLWYYTPKVKMVHERAAARKHPDLQRRFYRWAYALSRP